IAIRIGNERLDEQKQTIDRYTAAGIPAQQHGQSDDAPANSWSGRAAVIQGDGGRVQIRDSLWGEDKPSDKKHRWWRETQAGVLQTVQSRPSDVDPHPEVPECLRDPLWIIPKVNEIHRSSGSSSENDGEASPSNQASRGKSSSTQPGLSNSKSSRQDHKRWSGGDPLVQTIVATRQGYDHLGLALASEAYRRGFNKAKVKAFMGDGLKVNWSLWATHFSHYTPIVDIMHALAYVYGGAIASCGRIEEGWQLYVRWLQWIWSGDVARVIAAMKERASDQDEIPEDLRRAITYLSNNASRMRYANYRRDGLPVTTSPVESAQKQLNERIKGTEKFWREDSLEPLLQLKADDLSETHDRDAFWHRQGQRNDGFRHRPRKTKTKLT
ncbi:hypothetical protein, partial [Rhodopirellula sp. SWK7]|uniref:hypothetical protein n=1 Tax=Rhodopirellula sp. SWK7 TaxID=595460 RepID=UPI0005C4F8D0